MTLIAPKTGCALYLRVSSTEQSTEVNLDSQEGRCREYAKQQGLRVLRVFVDGGKTGRNINREAFKQLLTYCRQHRNELRAVIVLDVTRWARDVAGWATTLHTLEELGVEFHSVHERIDRTASGKFMGNIHAAVAQHFSDILSEKMKSVLHHRVQRGLFPWKAPLGYVNTPDPNTGSNISPDPIRGLLVTHAFNAVAAGIRCVEDVRRDLNAMGLRSLRGREIPSQSFHHLLHNELHAGWVVSGDVRVRGLHQPLTTDATFAAVQEVMKGKTPDRKPFVRSREDFPLRQFVTCARCGRNLTGGLIKKKKYSFYFCYNSACRAVSIRAEELTQHFVGLLEMHQPTQEALLSGHFSELAATRWAAMRDAYADTSRRLTQRKLDITTLTNAALEKLLRGTITDAQYKAFVEPNMKESEQIDEQLATLARKRVTLEEITKQVEAEAIDLAGTWKGATLEDKQSLQRSLFGAHLAFDPILGFLNSQNFLLMEKLTAFLVEGAGDNGGHEGWANDAELPKEEENPIGVGDGD